MGSYLFSAPPQDVPEAVSERLEQQAAVMWDRFYGRNADRFYKDRHWTDREWPELLSGPATVVEVGCGAGNTLFPLLTMNPHLTVYCCDFSPKAVALVKSNPQYLSGRVSAFVADLTADDLAAHVPPQSADFVTMVFVLSAVAPGKMLAALANAAQVLKPGGRLLFRDYEAGDLAQEKRETAGGRRLGERFFVRGDGTRCYYFTAAELRTLMALAGFSCASMHTHDRCVENRKRGISMQRRWLQGTFSLTGLPPPFAALPAAAPPRALRTAALQPGSDASAAGSCLPDAPPHADGHTTWAAAPQAWEAQPEAGHPHNIPAPAKSPLPHGSWQAPQAQAPGAALAATGSGFRGDMHSATTWSLPAPLQPPSPSPASFSSCGGSLPSQAAHPRGDGSFSPTPAVLLRSAGWFTGAAARLAAHATSLPGVPSGRALLPDTLDSADELAMALSPGGSNAARSSRGGARSAALPPQEAGASGSAGGAWGLLAPPGPEAVGGAAGMPGEGHADWRQGRSTHSPSTLGRGRPPGELREVAGADSPVPAAPRVRGSCSGTDEEGGGGWGAGRAGRMRALEAELEADFMAIVGRDTEAVVAEELAQVGIAGITLCDPVDVQLAYLAMQPLQQPQQAPKKRRQSQLHAQPQQQPAGQQDPALESWQQPAARLAAPASSACATPASAHLSGVVITPGLTFQVAGQALTPNCQPLLGGGVMPGLRQLPASPLVLDLCMARLLLAWPLSAPHLPASAVGGDQAALASSHMGGPASSSGTAAHGGAHLAPAAAPRQVLHGAAVLVLAAPPSALTAMTAVRKCGARRVLSTHSQAGSLAATASSLHANAAALVVERLKLAHLPSWNDPAPVRQVLTALDPPGGAGAEAALAAAGDCGSSSSGGARPIAQAAGHLSNGSQGDASRAGRCRVVLCPDLAAALAAEGLPATAVSPAQLQPGPAAGREPAAAQSGSVAAHVCAAWLAGVRLAAVGARPEHVAQSTVQSLRLAKPEMPSGHGCGSGMLLALCDAAQGALLQEVCGQLGSGWWLDGAASQAASQLAQEHVQDWPHGLHAVVLRPQA